METLKTFDGLMSRFASISPRKRVAVVCPDDAPTIGVIERCISEGLADMELIATTETASALISHNFCKHPSVNITIVPDKDNAAITAVKMIHDGRADVILKGNINTDNLLRAVLDKQSGLLPKGHVLSHVALTQIPGFNRLLMFSDAAVLPEPDLTQLDAVIRNDVALCRRLGWESPNVALIHFTEKFNDKFPVTTYYREILNRASQGDYGPINIGGPMDVKCACDIHSAEIKGLSSDMAGIADLLIFPNLAAANTFYKTLSLFARAEMAGMLTGTISPVVVPSRADSDESKLLSLAMACVVS